MFGRTLKSSFIFSPPSLCLCKDPQGAPLGVESDRSDCSGKSLAEDFKETLI